MSALPAFGSTRKPYAACFSVFASADPSVMPRVLEVFAKRGLTPTMWHSIVCGVEKEELQIDVQVADVDVRLTDHLAREMRQLVSVKSVLTSEKRYAMSA